MSRFTDTPRQLLDEIERLRAAYDKLCKDTPNFRNTVIEECARVDMASIISEEYCRYADDPVPAATIEETWSCRAAARIVAAIRALKDKP